jgi:hypothetical protein
MQATDDDLVTAQKFSRPFLLHVEFRVPLMPNARSNRRGKSGVFLQGRYEVLVLDSYVERNQVPDRGRAPYKDECGALYLVAAPLVNACKAPTIWQSYDIDFHPPQCRGGRKVSPARVTVYQNGMLIHDNVLIPVNNTLEGLGGDPCTSGPIMLQYGGSPVQFRNIWLVEQDG